MRSFKQLITDHPFKVSYKWVKAHQDDAKNWAQLSLEECLNVIVEGMTKKVLIALVVEQEFILGKFPFQKMRVETNGTKVDGSPRAALQRHWGYATAKEFYHSKRMINKYEFQLVWWDGCEKAMVGFPKNVLGVCDISDVKVLWNESPAVTL